MTEATTYFNCYPSRDEKDVYGLAKEYGITTRGGWSVSVPHGPPAPDPDFKKPPTRPPAAVTVAPNTDPRPPYFFVRLPSALPIEQRSAIENAVFLEMSIAVVAGLSERDTRKNMLNAVKEGLTNGDYDDLLSGEFYNQSYTREAESMKEEVARIATDVEGSSDLAFLQEVNGYIMDRPNGGAETDPDTVEGIKKQIQGKLERIRAGISGAMPTQLDNTCPVNLYRYDEQGEMVAIVNVSGSDRKGLLLDVFDDVDNDFLCKSRSVEEILESPADNALVKEIAGEEGVEMTVGFTAEKPDNTHTSPGPDMCTMAWNAPIPGGNAEEFSRQMYWSACAKNLCDKTDPDEALQMLKLATSTNNYALSALAYNSAAASEASEAPDHRSRIGMTKRIDQKKGAKEKYVARGGSDSTINYFFKKAVKSTNDFLKGVAHETIMGTANVTLLCLKGTAALAESSRNLILQSKTDYVNSGNAETANSVVNLRNSMERLMNVPTMSDIDFAAEYSGSREQVIDENIRKMAESSYSITLAGTPGSTPHQRRMAAMFITFVITSMWAGRISFLVLLGGLGEIMSVVTDFNTSVDAIGEAFDSAPDLIDALVDFFNSAESVAEEAAQKEAGSVDAQKYIDQLLATDQEVPESESVTNFRKGMQNLADIGVKDIDAMEKAINMSELSDLYEVMQTDPEMEGSPILTHLKVVLESGDGDAKLNAIQQLMEVLPDSGVDTMDMQEMISEGLEELQASREVHPFIQFFKNLYTNYKNFGITLFFSIFRMDAASFLWLKMIFEVQPVFFLWMAVATTLSTDISFMGIKLTGRILGTTRNAKFFYYQNVDNIARGTVLAINGRVHLAHHYMIRNIERAMKTDAYAALSTSDPFARLEPLIMDAAFSNNFNRNSATLAKYLDEYFSKIERPNHKMEETEEMSEKSIRERIQHELKKRKNTVYARRNAALKSVGVTSVWNKTRLDGDTYKWAMILELMSDDIGIDPHIEERGNMCALPKNKTANFVCNHVMGKTLQDMVYQVIGDDSLLPIPENIPQEHRVRVDSRHPDAPTVNITPQRRVEDGISTAYAHNIKTLVSACDKLYGVASSDENKKLSSRKLNRLLESEGSEARMRTSDMSESMERVPLNQLLLEELYLYSNLNKQRLVRQGFRRRAFFKYMGGGLMAMLAKQLPKTSYVGRMATYYSNVAQIRVSDAMKNLNCKHKKYDRIKALLTEDDELSKLSDSGFYSEFDSGSDSDEIVPDTGSSSSLSIPELDSRNPEYKLPPINGEIRKGGSRSWIEASTVSLAVVTLLASFLQ